MDAYFASKAGTMSLSGIHLVMIKKSPLKKMYDNQTFFYYVENNKHTNYGYLFSMEQVVFLSCKNP